jgi:hypothetical protein
MRRNNAGWYDGLCPTRCNANTTSLEQGGATTTEGWQNREQGNVPVIASSPLVCVAIFLLIVRREQPCCAPKYFGSIEGRLNQL